MAFHNRHKKKQEEDEAWLMTYADTITLLMAFFIILLTLSEPKQERIEALGAVLSEAMDSEISQPFTDLNQNIQMMIVENMMEESMSVEETNRGLVIEIASSSFYESGSAEFKKDAIPVLLDLATLLAEFDYEDYTIKVAGHTDDSPINSTLFPSNWELSAGRATRVIRFFIEEGIDSKRLSVEAFAETKPKVPNLDDKGNPVPENRELNRRIQIAVERGGM
jgi:chemotaxis protein MotB